MGCAKVRTRAISQYEAGDKLEAIAAEAGVHKSTVSKWAREAGMPPRQAHKTNSYKFDYHRTKLANDGPPSDCARKSPSCSVREDGNT